MKKIILLASLFMMCMGVATAQKYACVNTEYILTSIPDYEQAQKTLDKLSIDWQKEIETKFQEIDNLYKKYQTEAASRGRSDPRGSGRRPRREWPSYRR
jgi:outer membrane protein